MTVYYDDEAIAAQLPDWGNVMTATPDGGDEPVIGPCMYNESDELKLDSANSAATVMRIVRVTIQTSLWTFLQGGSLCSVDGVNYSVYKRLQEGDGGVTNLLLQVEP